MKKTSKKELLRTLKSTYSMVKMLSHFVRFEKKCFYWLRDIAYYSLWLQLGGDESKDVIKYKKDKIIELYNQVNNEYIDF